MLLKLGKHENEENHGRQTPAMKSSPPNSMGRRLCDARAWWFWCKCTLRPWKELEGPRDREEIERPPVGNPSMLYVSTWSYRYHKKLLWNQSFDANSLNCRKRWIKLACYLSCCWSSFAHWNENPPGKPPGAPRVRPPWGIPPPKLWKPPPPPRPPPPIWAPNICMRISVTGVSRVSFKYWDYRITWIDVHSSSSTSHAASKAIHWVF